MKEMIPPQQFTNLLGWILMVLLKIKDSLSGIGDTDFHELCLENEDTESPKSDWKYPLPNERPLTNTNQGNF